ncbi:MAG: metallophosphoesterase [Chloroflexi bacterium]|nr:MAG: metallophosphoesterase [Chloroflexota bacterium]
MKIALIGDVHANLPALEAVLDHAHAQKVDALWNVGDWVGYNAFPNAVIDRLRAEGAVGIAGNYDLKVLAFKKKCQKWQHSKHPQKYLAFGWAYRQLKKKNRRYLRSLPLEITLNFEKTSVLLTHGSPASNQEGLTPATPIARLQALAAMTSAQIIVCGHSHRPFARQVDGRTWFINTGSVGRPDDGDPRAAYAILTLRKNLVQVRHFRLAYNVDRAAAEIRRAGLPPEFELMLRRGCNLDQIYAESGQLGFG